MRLPALSFNDAFSASGRLVLMDVDLVKAGVVDPTKVTRKKRKGAEAYNVATNEYDGFVALELARIERFLRGLAIVRRAIEEPLRQLR